MEHPYPFTVDLLKQVIDKAPVFFPARKKREMLATFVKMQKNTKTRRQDIEQAIIDFGREIWPYRKSFWSIHDTDGRPREEQYLLAAAKKEGVDRTYASFVKKGGSYDDLRYGSARFEEFFQPEEKAALVRARMDAHEKVVREIHELCSGERVNQCTMYFARYRQEQVKIDTLIAAFRVLASKTKKWREEILHRAHVFETGWSGVERETTRTEVEAAIDYYRSMLTHYNGFLGQ